MTKKNTIRLTESDLKKIITESVKKILKEEVGVLPGTSKKSSEYHSADEWSEYINQDTEEETVNDRIPDFAYTLAQRLEQQIKNKCAQILPNVDMENSEFAIAVWLDKDSTEYESLKTYSYGTDYTLHYDVRWHLCSTEGYFITEDKRLNNRIKSIIIKYASMILGNLEGADITIGENGRGYIDVIVTFHDYEQWRDSGNKYDGYEKTYNNTSALFKNNPSRQIPGRRK